MAIYHACGNLSTMRYGMLCREREKFGYKRIVRINGIDNFMATTALCLTRQAGHTHTHKERTEGEGGKCS